MGRPRPDESARWRGQSRRNRRRPGTPVASRNDSRRRDTAYNVEVGYDERPTDGIQSHLDAQLKRMGAEAPVTHRWAGTMGFTETGLPLVGPVAGMANVYTCAGFNGHGMGFAFISAKQLIDSM